MPGPDQGAVLPCRAPPTGRLASPHRPHPGLWAQPQMATLRVTFLTETSLRHLENTSLSLSLRRQALHPPWFLSQPPPATTPGLPRSCPDRLGKDVVTCKTPTASAPCLVLPSRGPPSVLEPCDFFCQRMHSPQPVASSSFPGLLYRDLQPP